MTLDEFMSLKEGDQIQGFEGGPGTVVRTDDSRGRRIVTVAWGPSAVEFNYSVQTTAWMHWTKLESVMSTGDASSERVD